jgi:hypothetical protein
VGSMGVALTTCTVPGGVLSDRIGEDEMELGLGIHNEPGRTKTKVLSANEVVRALISEIEGIMHCSNKAVALMVNNLGGSPLLELYVVANAAHKELEKLNVTVARSYVGSFMTSLEMQGIMITLCEVDESRLGKHGRARCRYLARCTTLIPLFFCSLASSTVGRGNASARLAQDRNQQHGRVLRRSERWVETMFGNC